MGLYEKVEEIRNKPEHIRMRYVWAMVAFSMLCVLAIWFFSLQSDRTAGSIMPSEVVNPNITQQLQQQKDDLQNTAGGIMNALQSGGNGSQQDSNNNQ